VTKTPAWTPETVSLVRMAALTILSHGVHVTSHGNGDKVVYVLWDQLLAVVQATGITPAARASETVDCVHISLQLDGITYHSTCWVDSLKHFGIEAPAVKEGVGVGA
jgi:hypothetical protein